MASVDGQGRPGQGVYGADGGALDDETLHHLSMSGHPMEIHSQPSGRHQQEFAKAGVRGSREVGFAGFASGRGCADRLMDVG
jgi:hypothetical protein